MTDSVVHEVLIRRDQVASIRRSTLISLPVGSMVGAIVMLVARRYGHGVLGGKWFAAIFIINIIRVILCITPLPPLAGEKGPSRRFAAFAGLSVEKYLHLFWITSLVSGLLWSLIFLFCNGYTTPQTVFYLTVVCGITAGAVTTGIAYAPVPISFTIPPLLSVIGCLLYAGGFNYNSLAATVLLYLIMLISVSRQSEASFRAASRLKNDASAMAESLKKAHTESVLIAEQMSHRATHDELTGLFNRTGFSKQVEKYAASGPATFCLMLLDLDGFKLVNDGFGHATGDKVLVEVSHRLREVLAGEFTVARIGGDEFAVFYAQQASGESPHVLATRLIAAIEAPYAEFDTSRVGVSIGIYQSQDVNIANMLTSADEALYAAKFSGRNRYRMFDEYLRERLSMKCDVERDLQRALSKKEVEVWYQPVFSIDGKNIINYEALLRWKHPTHGWISPADLVLIAAKAGHSEQLMSFIFDEVCGMIQTLRSLNLEHIWVAMNMSPRDVSNLPIDECVLNGLKVLNLPAQMLEIEVTEETAMDTISVQTKINRLSEVGVRIAVDDFGAGYSSLASLRKLSVNRIKIDRCFITGITESANDKILVQTILKLGQSLGLEVVAEGVETAEVLHLLRGFGCELVQGYYLGYPAPKQEIISRLQKLETQKSCTMTSNFHVNLQ
ncbi:bifunctional diguanylate cyclase/phosphodiesterase [Acidocella sp.]|uniref:putative bifunctional diguanylate cyclase/phosphodiesterase n=1 Tax=Acidocella sp. TaxID=50710 RepID=UPI0025BB9B8B|nr:EAL domain-containing protein [Acidocella sp.]